MDEAAPLLSEVATPRTARGRRLGDFLASTVSGIALVLVLVALVATTPSQWADAVRNVGGSHSSGAMFADSRLGNSTRAADTLANLGAQWPGTFVLASKGALERQSGRPAGFAFYVVAAASVAVGACWLALMGKRVLALQDRPASSWLVTEEEGAEEA